MFDFYSCATQSNINDGDNLKNFDVSSIPENESKVDRGYFSQNNIQREIKCESESLFVVPFFFYFHLFFYFLCSVLCKCWYHLYSIYRRVYFIAA